MSNITNISLHKRRRASRQQDPRTAQNVDPIRGAFLMSNRTYACLRIFTDQPKSFTMHKDDALLVDQRSFGSIYHNGFITFSMERGGFVATEKGRNAAKLFEGTDVFKPEAGSSFSHFIPLIKALSIASRRSA